jgi:hypothetical protein
MEANGGHHFSHPEEVEGSVSCCGGARLHVAVVVDRALIAKDAL